MAKIGAEATAEASAEARMGAEAGISAEAVQKRHLCRSQKPFAQIVMPTALFIPCRTMDIGGLQKGQ